MSGTISEPVPNDPLPFHMMDLVVDIKAAALPKVLQDSYRKLVDWKWNRDYIAYRFYWLSHEANIIVVAQYQSGYSSASARSRELRRQTYLRLKGNVWHWADIFDPEIQDLLAGWLVMGKMNPGEAPWPRF